MIALQGQGASRGIAFGRLVFFCRVPADVERRSIADSEAEIRRFQDARGKAILELTNLEINTKKKLGEEKSMLFQIHQMMLEDLDYGNSVTDIIKNEMVCAEYAVSETAKKFAAMFANMDDDYMRGRAADVKDVSSRVLRILMGMKENIQTEEGSYVLAADDLVPSETAQLNKNQVLAIITAGGSVNSHTAIFARTMGIPAVIDLRKNIKPDFGGKTVAVNGTTGEVLIEPDTEKVEELRAAKEQEDFGKRRLEVYKDRPTATKDGKKIEICANIGDPGDLEAVLSNGAEGIGLFRSEFLYLESNDYPSEEKQFEAYKTVAEKLSGKRVVIRTLDLGADKQAAYFHLPKEENPAMGLRAIRICLTRPQIFKTQLRALYRASAFGRIAIMFPMITSVEEVRQIKKIASEVCEELKAENIKFNKNTELGIMIETPAAALVSDELAKEVDFFSIGTNDLTQYTLAVDRQNQNLSQFCNRHHPAILKLIRMTAENAHKAGIWTGICGELGADESLTRKFLDFGIDELSVSPSAILGLRAKISEIDMRKENGKSAAGTLS